MSDSLTYYANKLKKVEKCMKTEVNPFSVPIDKTIISPHFEWCIGKCPGLCTAVFKMHMVPKIEALSRSYSDCLETLDFCFIFMPNPCSEGFKTLTLSH